jgi:scyllo-inositol 2-dehydrogenase (NADP+)
MTLGVGLVGYRLAGKAFHGPLVKATKGLEVSAICTSSDERGAQAKADYPDARIVKRFDDLLGAQGVDLIVIGTPHDTHRDLAVRALEAGFHVVTDKIMCLGIEEADQMIEASKRSGKMLSVFHNRRWDSDFLTLRACLAAKLIGDACVIESAVLRAGPETTPAPSPTQRPWRQRADKGGGPFRDWGAHLMDQAMILGDGVPETVSCDLQFRRPNLDVETLATCSMRFAGGLRVRIEAGAHSWIQRPRWYVQGTEGSLKMEGLDPQEGWLRKGEVVARTEQAKFDSGRTQVINVAGTAALDMVPGDYLAFYENVAAHLTDGTPLAVTPESCREVLRVYEAAFESARRNQIIRIG